MGDAPALEVGAPTTAQGTIQDAWREECMNTFNNQLDAAETTSDFLNLLGTVETFIIGQNAQSVPDRWSFQFIWHMMIKIAIESPKDDAVQERVVYMLITTREIALQSKNESDGVKAIDGRRIWIDLPYLIDILGFYWKNETFSTLRSNQQYNLAAFSARLLAAGICGDEIGIFALRCFRKILNRESTKNFDTMNTCIAWLFYSRYRILNMSLKARKYNQGYMFSCGVLSEEEKDGFSLELWLKWRESFKELTVGGHKIIKAEATEGYRLMIVCGHQMGYDIPGEQEYLDRVKMLMEGVMQESGMECASLDDIEGDIN